MTLPTDAAERKATPIATGVLDYFPDALAAVAHCSKVGNDQHNPGQPLHWDKEKSTDEADALIRHFLERGTIDTDGVRHSAKVAWRALALLQREIEVELQARASEARVDWAKINAEFVKARDEAGLIDRLEKAAKGQAEEKFQARINNGPFPDD